MKKYLVTMLTVMLALCVMTANSVQATDFSKNEDYYIKLCSSSHLTKSKASVCKEFNAYLKKKNANLKDSIANTKDNLDQTNENLSAVLKKVDAIESDIAKKEKEISYMETSIKNYQIKIQNKQDQIKQRLYAMQSYYNSDSYVAFLFGSQSLTDFFSRLASISDITSYEKDLVTELTEAKQELDNQLDSLTDAKANLQSQKNTANNLKKKYIELAAAQKQQINDQTKEQKETAAAQAKIDAALDALVSHAPGGSTSGSVVPGNSAKGNAIANAALTKLGCRYWWGKEGPTYFDCSGLVYWACRQAGVGVGRLTAAGYSVSGRGVSYSQLQAGDVVTFSYGSGVAHIAIYIGGGKIVQALGKGSGTVGQYADQCVKVSTLAGYWQGYVYNYRRLY